ncbi:MAG: hypothetical protein JWO79_271 [Actinomycetia bacterium]|nr:hypothetical protein [Actinomycetes bacterium]
MTDEEQIHALWRQMEDGWSGGSGPRFAAPFAEDADFVTVRGEATRGRGEIADRHGALFDTAYAGSALAARVESIRYLRPDLALVHATSTVTPPGGRPPMTTHAQAVAERRAGGWQIVAFHNMVPLTPTGVSA